MSSTMFGYSLSFLNRTLLIGAPKVNVSGQPDITESGGVYSCSFSGDKQCQLLQLDNRPNNIGKLFNQNNLTPAPHTT